MSKLFSIFLLLVCFQSVIPQSVLEFDNRERHNIIVKKYYRDYTPAKNQTYGNFTIQTWVKPLPIPAGSPSDNQNGGYFVSQGYGGIHAILLGQFTNGNGNYNVAGNFDVVHPNNPCTPTEDTSSTVSFATPYVFQENVWSQVTVELFGTTLTIFKNGTRIYQKLGVTGERIAGVCTGDDPFGQDLYLGGSDHINFHGRMALLALWEDYAVYKGKNFVPHITPNLLVVENAIRYGANLAYDMTDPQHTLADISPRGFAASSGFPYLRHPGILNSAKNGLVPRVARNSHPQFVQDTDFPLFNANWVPSTVPTPDFTLPPNTVVGDTFSRADSNRFTGLASLGTTEIGNETYQPHIAGTMSIINGKFYANLPNFYQSNLVEAVSNGSGSISRNGDSDVGVMVRATNGNNGIVIFVSGNRLFVGRVQNGGFAWNSSIISGSWNDITFTFNGANISATAGSTTVNWTDTIFQSATKAGLYCFSPTAICSGDNFYIAS